jgi:hypothetical protein
MATCKDCLHNPICSVDNDRHFMLIGCVNVETSCINFTNRAKYMDRCEDCTHRDDPVTCSMWIKQGLCHRGMGVN